MATQQLHDASTGFHDIKPLPQFSPSYWLEYSLIAVTALLVAALVYWLRKHFTRAPKIIEPVELPHTKAIRLLRDLERSRVGSNVSIREISTSISLTIRLYIEEVFEISASDMTESEFFSVFPDTLRNKILLTSETKKLQILDDLKALLKRCNYLSFSRNSEKEIFVESSEVKETIDIAISLIQQLSYQLSRENNTNAA